jgi:signal transduction histidine kinase
MNAYYPYILIGSSLILRKALLRYQPLNFLFISLIGLGWGLLFFYASTHFGVFAFESLFVLSTIIILISVGVTVFSPSLTAAYIFQSAILIVPITHLLSKPGDPQFIVGTMLVVNLLFQFYHTYISHQFLKKSFLNENKVSSQNKSLQEFIDAIPGLVAVIDDEHCFIMVNNHFNGIFKEGLGKKVESFLPESGMKTTLMDFLKSSKDSDIQEVSSHDEGIENWYMINLSRITSPQKGIIATILPITDLVKAKSDLKIQEARSQYAARLASLGELSAGIAHEVNNPLTIIEGAASLMKVLLAEDQFDRSEFEKVTAKITATTHRIAKIIKSLRTLSVNAEEDPFKNVSFFSVIEPTLEISQTRLDAHKIELRVIYPDVEVELFGNEIQLSQVVMNLVTNAIDAVKDSPEPRWIEIDYRPSFEWLDILITDNGVGVAPENRERIMDAFFTTKVSYQGSGLGLSISKNIMQSHNGTLTLLLEEKYTTFRMRLPRMNPWKSSKKNVRSVVPDVLPE